MQPLWYTNRHETPLYRDSRRRAGRVPGGGLFPPPGNNCPGVSFTVTVPFATESSDSFTATFALDAGVSLLEDSFFTEDDETIFWLELDSTFLLEEDCLLLLLKATEEEEAEVIF